MTVALAILELSSIARAIRVSDAIVKRAPVELWQSRPVSTGKHVIVFGGGVAEVDESFREAVAVAADTVIDRLFLSYAHAQLAPLLRGHAAGRPVTDSVGVVETRTVCSAVAAADASCKAAQVTVVDLHLAVGIGGKAFYTLTGDLNDIEAAVEAATQAAAGNLLATEIIPAPHAELTKLVF